MRRIIRVEHRRSPYVVIDRRPVENKRLSGAARGLLGYLVAKPDDWWDRVSDLCRRGDLGCDGIHRVLQQLEDLGYVRHARVRKARGLPATIIPRDPHAAVRHTGTRGQFGRLNFVSAKLLAYVTFVPDSRAANGSSGSSQCAGRA